MKNVKVYFFFGPASGILLKMMKFGPFRDEHLNFLDSLRTTGAYFFSSEAPLVIFHISQWGLDDQYRVVNTSWKVLNFNNNNSSNLQVKVSKQQENCSLLLTGKSSIIYLAVAEVESKIKVVFLINQFIWMIAVPCAQLHPLNKL